MLDFSYPKILELFPEHLDPHRSESAAFLIWYLENYYRLDSSEAVEAICDQKGDKGIDGIFVSEEAQTITVFQSRIYQDASRTMGDGALKSFSGTLAQFGNAQTVQDLIEAAGSAQVSSLLKRIDVVNKIATHELFGMFLSNVDLDSNGKRYLESVGGISYVGDSELKRTYISDERNLPTSQVTVAFDIGGFSFTKYSTQDAEAIIAPVKATELVTLDGIENQSLYHFNVRGPLGNTKVNKDIRKSINDPRTHKMFPLFHNGITIIAKGLEANTESLTMSGPYYVVNGCQSLTELFRNRSKLTDDLRVLTKIIKLEPTSPWAQVITTNSNNQNGVKPRDWKANNPIQIRLQNEFRQHYDGTYFYKIKRGEDSGAGQVIENELAGLFLMAFDLKEPWATHRRYQVFEDRHADLFGRPEVTAGRIVLCQVIVDEIGKASTHINNTLVAKYVLTRYLLLYVARCLLEGDEVGQEALLNPETFVQQAGDRERFGNCIGALIQDAVTDMNEEVSLLGDDFDYRGKLRDSDWVKQLANEIVGTHMKLSRRKKIQSFGEAWKSG